MKIEELKKEEIRLNELLTDLAKSGSQSFVCPEYEKVCSELDEIEKQLELAKG